MKLSDRELDFLGEVMLLDAEMRGYVPMRDRNPSNNENWKVVCSVCGAQFASDELIDLVGGHFQQEHPELDHPHLNTIWAGIGPMPKPGYRSGRVKRRRR